MATLYTIDASVFVNAFNPREAGHQTSNALLRNLRDRAAPIVVPTLLLPEVAAAIARGRNDEALARRFANALARWPHLVLVSLDPALSQRAVDVAATSRLRGSDAIYAATVLQFGSTLVTLDREQHDRIASIVVTLYPGEALGHPPQP